ncbi:hypothetical protein JOF56_004408 [Kibdelosporangium banguiense]|uniref:Uncharacterized protein n=1 Tax=Kibdelosporangium banguiense TaxID=1365924 RepID=A0ABS4TJE3_9PSEU|nr:hypothetical protein [Kibdelosporangium banguiense]MBP2324023.1 hypothetical protein [Kibdelosporangium banguiense]
MLYLILLLVVASLGLLIAALTTANTLWAWISVLISVVAAGLLVLDWIRNRRRRRSREEPAADRASGPGVREREQSSFEPSSFEAAPLPPETDVTAQQQAVTAQGQHGHQERQHDSGDAFPDPFEESFRDFDEPKLGEPPFGTSTGSFALPVEPPEPITAIHEPVTAVQEPVIDMDTEPGEENTDATDVLTVSELSDEVVVIDERPRYHLVTCAWLNNRPTMGLPVSEARDLGFTPCALCAPDSTLAARRRARS